MVYDTRNEDPERGDYRSLYSDQDENDEEIDTPSTTPLYTHPSTTNTDANPESKSKPNPQFQQNLRLPTSTEVFTIAKAVFGALGFMIGILLCTLAIISLIWGCGQVVDHIRHIGDPSSYRRLSDYVAVEDDIDDPYSYPNPYSYYPTDDDTVPEATTTGKGIEITCKGEAGVCEGSLSELMRIPKATSVAVIMDGWEGWGDILGEDLDEGNDVGVGVDGWDDVYNLPSDDLYGDVDEGEFPDELVCGNMWMEEDEGVVVDELEYVSVLDRLWNELFGV